MKKLATLILAAGMVFGAATGASAIDFKAKGQWIMSFDYGEHGKFSNNYKNNSPYGWNGKEDDFEAKQRVRLQLDAVASESLSGTVWFEIGTQYWGNAADGGALGTDGKVVKVKNAYIDWMVPETDLKVRMGLQHVTLPSFTLGGSTVMDDDVAGITASFKVNDNVSITGIWMRPFNDNFGGWNVPGSDYNSTGNYMDNMDLGVLLVPLTFDGAKVTPWAMYGAIGPNTFRTGERDFFGNKNLSNMARSGLLPVGGSRYNHARMTNGIHNGKVKQYEQYFMPKSRNLTSYGDAWWGGITGELTMWDPMRIAWDFTYGSVTWDDNGSLNRQGWLASLLFEYKMDWGIPGIYGWYGSGDDSNPANGSERMPTLSDDNTNGFSNFAFGGDRFIARDGVVSKGSMSGTWGVGIRLKDMSFVEDLKHTFRVNYIGGTNSPSMAKKMSLGGLWANGMALTGDSFGQGSLWRGMGAGLGFDGMYLTTEDSALEFGLTNTYKMYENFVINLEADYIAMFLDTDKSVWGARHRIGQSIPSTSDAWNINASFVYSF